MPPDLTTAEGQAMALIFLMRRRRRKYLAQKKRIWMRQALKRQAERSAELLGPELKLVTELQQPDEDDRFQKHYSLSREQFEALLTLTAPRIDKAAAATALVKPIPAKESLAICLRLTKNLGFFPTSTRYVVTSIGQSSRVFSRVRFLATGDSYGSIAASFNVGDAVVAKLVPRVCKAIWSSLKDTFLPASNASDWLEVAKGFHERWDFPNCVGALDGKHIMVKASPPLPAAVASSAAAAASDAAEGDVEAAQGHVMESPKRKPSPASSSITVLAVADAFSCFRMIEVCPFGRKSDRGMFAASEFGKALHEGKLGLPEDAPLPGVASDLGPMPHVFISGESFPLKQVPLFFTLVAKNRTKFEFVVISRNCGFKHVILYRRRSCHLAENLFV